MLSELLQTMSTFSQMYVNSLIHLKMLLELLTTSISCKNLHYKLDKALNSVKMPLKIWTNSICATSSEEMVLRRISFSNGARDSINEGF